MEKKPPQPGEVFAGKFRIESLLGQGGMGAVYLAHHKDLNKRFAIKVLLGEIADNPEAVARFKNEASAAAGIQNQHVAQVSDVSETETGLPYMVMEYLEGCDLAQLLEKRGPLPPAEAVDYVLQALEAVHQAHEAKIVHRDLKPSNLFLANRSDGTTIVKVLDFGISKMQAGEQSGALTSTRSMLGSPLYMSPEQLRSSKTVDARSDIWAIGVILYELLTGTVPYVGEALGELFAAILEQDPVPLSERNPEIDPGLEQVVMRCLRKKRDERWGSVIELAVALAPFAPAGKQGALAQRATLGLMPPGSIPMRPIYNSTAMLTSSGSTPAQGSAGTLSQGRSPLPSGGAHTGSASWATADGTGGQQDGAARRTTAVAIAIAVSVCVALGIGMGGVMLFRSQPTAASSGVSGPRTQTTDMVPVVTTMNTAEAIPSSTVSQTVRPDETTDPAATAAPKPSVATVRRPFPVGPLPVSGKSSAKPVNTAAPPKTPGGDGRFD